MPLEDSKIQRRDGKDEIKVDAIADLTFLTRNIPNLLVMIYWLMASSWNIFRNDVVSVYTHLVDNQNTGDVKTPELPLVDSGKRIEFGKVLTLQRFRQDHF